MRQHVFLTMGLAGFLSVAACHKAAPVAAHPASQAPVAAAPASAAPEPAPRTSAPSARPSPPEAPPSTTITPQERATLNDRLARMEDALFDYNKATIRADATTALKDDVDVIRGILGNYPSLKLVIEGYADERGSDEYNLALGDKRARAAEEFLTTMGIPQTQLTVISYGKERPVCTDSTEACWQKNRRVHITAAS
jgi:peptidoglycan-associated lipoprotein